MHKETKSILQLLQTEHLIVQERNDIVHEIGVIEANIAWHTQHGDMEDPGGHLLRASKQKLPEKEIELADVEKRLDMIHDELRSVLKPILEDSYVFQQQPLNVL